MFVININYIYYFPVTYSPPPPLHLFLRGWILYLGSFCGMFDYSNLEVEIGT